MAAELRDKLKQIDGVTATDDGFEKCGIVTFMAEQMDPTAIKSALAKYRINVSTPKGSGSLVSFRHRGLTHLVRTSLHYYNTNHEVDYFVTTLQKILQGAK